MNNSGYILGLTTDASIDEMHEILTLGNQFENRLLYDQVKSEVSFKVGDDFVGLILDKAEKKNVDLIVITGSSVIENTDFLSSTFSQQIINRAKVPVLCIKTN